MAEDFLDIDQQNDIGGDPKPKLPSSKPQLPSVKKKEAPSWAFFGGEKRVFPSSFKNSNQSDSEVQSTSKSNQPSSPVVKNDLTGIENSLYEYVSAEERYKKANVESITPMMAPGFVPKLESTKKQEAKAISDAASYTIQAKDLKDAVLKAQKDKIVKPIQELVKDGGYKKFLTDTGYFDYGKANEHFDKYVSERGGGGYTRNMMVALAKQAVESERDRPSYEKYLKKNMDAFGIDMKKYGEDFLKQMISPQVKTLELAKKESQQKAAQYFDKLKPVAAEIGNVYQQSISNLQERFKNGQISEADANSELQLLNNDYTAKIKELDNNYNTEIKNLNNKLLEKYNRIQKEIDVVTKNIKDEDVWKSIPKEDQIKIKLAQQDAAAKVQKENAKKKQVEDTMANAIQMPGAPGAGLLGKSVASGWNSALADFGDYLSFKGWDNDFIQSLQSKRTKADELAPAQYSWSKDPFLRAITSTGTSLGASLPTTGVAATVTLGSGGLGLPAVVGTIAGGLTSFMGETAQNTGGVYRELLNKGYDISEASVKAQNFKEKQARLLPLYFLEAAGLQNVVKKGLGKTLLGGAQELGQELPTEYWQGYTQAIETGDFSGTFEEYIKKNPELSLDVIAGTIGQTGVMKTAAKTYQAIFQKAPSPQKQFYADMIEKGGVEVALTNLQQQLENELISVAEYQVEKKKIDEVVATLGTMKELGMKGDNAKAFIAFSDRVKELTEKAATEKNETTKILYQQKISEAKAELTSIAKGEGVYAVITFPGGENQTVVMRVEDVTDSVLKNAEDVMVKNDPLASKDLKERKKELGIPKDAPIGMYKQNTTEEKVTLPKEGVTGDALGEKLSSEKEQKIGTGASTGLSRGDVEGGLIKPSEIKEDYELDRKNVHDFTLDLEQSVGFGVGEIGYSKKGDAVMRIKEHTPEWGYFQEDIENGAKKIINVTIGDFNNSDYRRNKASMDEMKQRNPDVDFLDIQIPEGMSLKDAADKITKEVNEFYKSKFQSYSTPSKEQTVEIKNETIQERTESPQPITSKEKSESKEGATEDVPPPEPPKGEAAVEGDEGKDLSGIKKGLLSSEFIKDVDLEKVSDKEMMSIGRKILDSGEINPDALVTKIITEGKGVLTPAEVVGLITYKRDIDNEVKDKTAEFNKRKAAGEETGTLGVEIAKLNKQREDYDVMSLITAQQQSLAFRLRQYLLDRDYNAVREIERYKKVNNGSIPPEVEARLKAVEKELKEAKEKLAKAEEANRDADGQEAVDNIKEKTDRENQQKSEKEKKTFKERAKRAADTFRKLKTKPFKFKDENGNEYDVTKLGFSWNDLVELGARAIEKTGEIADGIKAVFDKIQNAEWYKKLSKNDKERFLTELEDYYKSEAENSPEGRRIKQLEKQLEDLQQGIIKSRNEPIDSPRIQELKEQIFDAKKNLGLIPSKMGVPKTDYGLKETPEYKNLQRLQKKLDDLLAGKVQGKKEKRELTQEEKDLQEEIFEAKKKLGLTPSKPLKEVKVDKTSEQKRLERLEKELDDLRQGIIKERADKLEDTPESKRLKDEIYEAKKNLGLIKGRPLPEPPVIKLNEDGSLSIPPKMIEDLVSKGVTDINELVENIYDEAVKVKPDATKREVRDAVTNYGEKVNPTAKELDTKINTAKRVGRLLSELEDLQKMTSAQFLLKYQKPKPNANKITDAEKELKRKIKALIRDEFVDVELKTDAQKIKEEKERVRNRIAELEGQKKSGDFSKKKKNKVKPTDEELERLKIEEQNLIAEVEEIQYKNELKNRTLAQKIEDEFYEWTLGITRGLTLGVDLSAPGIQGMRHLFISPVKSAQAFWESFKFLASEKYGDRFLARLKASPYYPQMAQTGLIIDDKVSKVNVKEAIGISNKVNWIWNKLISPVLGLGTKRGMEIARKLNPYAAGQRAYNGYVNVLRTKIYIEQAKELERSGYSFEADPEVFKKSAGLANTETASAHLGKADLNSKWLNLIFTAPRKWVSEFKLYTPYAFIYYARLPKPVRKRALLNAAKFTVSFVTVNAIIWALRKDWDDEEDDHFWDITSSDFMTHKIGNKRIGIGGGAKSIMVLMGRLFNGEYTDQHGNTTKLGERFGKEINSEADLLISYGAGKFTPLLGATYKKLDESKGREIDNIELIRNLSIPMWMQDLKDIYKDDPVTVGAYLNLMSILGAQVRVVEESKGGNIMDKLKEFGEPLLKDYEKSKNDDLLPPTVRNFITVDGIKKKMTPEQAEQFEKLVTEQRKEVLAPLMDGTEKVPDENGNEVAYSQITDEKLKIYLLQKRYKEGYRRGKILFQTANKDFMPKNPEEAGEEEPEDQ